MERILMVSPKQLKAFAFGTKRMAALLLLLTLLTACAPAAAPADVTPAPTPRQWDAAPAMQIDPDKQYSATLDTDKGKIVVELLAKDAPITVNNFVFLARQGFYDGVTFHRVLKDFMAQGGDPTGTGMGGPGYFIPNENDSALFDRPGLLAMANSGRDRNGSQFFITFQETPHLNGGYTIFGRVTSGLEVALALTLRNPDENPGFPGDKLNSVTIEEK